MYSTVTIPAPKSANWAPNYTTPLGQGYNLIVGDLNLILAQYSQASLKLSLDALKTEVGNDTLVQANLYTDTELAEFQIYVESLSFTGLPPENFNPNDVIKINDAGTAFEGVQIEAIIETQINAALTLALAAATGIY
jgi:hypothetical protein